MSAGDMLWAVAVAAVLAAVLGAALGWAALRLRPDEGSLVERIDALLPQTQCGQCRHPGCRPYALAIARGEAGIDQCPPGGDATARALARLLGREPSAVNPEFGVATSGLVALIDEARCIGCALCLPACPVDAIVGTSRRMHTVIEAHCTGCGLCVPTCPVDCIAMGATAVASAPRGRRAA
jgi:Na+-translocating ferredoxin:NAD+ oxidoreductase subunit B